jgi:hypothetical protein
MIEGARVEPRIYRWILRDYKFVEYTNGDLPGLKSAVREVINSCGVGFAIYSQGEGELAASNGKTYNSLDCCQ